MERTGVGKTKMAARVSPVSLLIGSLTSIIHCDWLNFYLMWVNKAGGDKPHSHVSLVTVLQSVAVTMIIGATDTE